MKKRTSYLVALLCLTMLGTMGVFASGGKEEAAKEESLAGSKITFLTHPTLLKSMGGNETFDSFKERTGIETEVVTMPTPQIREKVMMEFVAGTGRYDLINVSNTIYNTDVVNYLEPLDDLLKEYPYPDYSEIFPALVDGFRFPLKTGKIYGIPYRSGTALIFYRTDLFQQEGLTIPQNWDQLKDISKKLTKDTDGDGKIDIYGYAVKCGDTHTISEDFLRYLYSFGGSILSDDLKKATINEPPGIAAAELLLWFVKEKVVPPDFATWIRDDLIVAQQQGRVAMSLQFSPYFGMITDPELSKVGDVTSAFAVPTAPGIPVGATYNATWALAIDQKSRNKRAAWEVIKMLTDKENQLNFALNNANGPISKYVFESQEYQQFLSPEIADAWQLGLANGVSTPPHPDYGQMEETWGRELTAALLMQKTPKQALDNAAKRINEILGN